METPAKEQGQQGHYAVGNSGGSDAPSADRQHDNEEQQSIVPDIDQEQAALSQRQKETKNTEHSSSVDAMKGNENTPSMNPNLDGKFYTITIPPGRLGLIVSFVKGGGAVIDSILSPCAVKGQVQIGDFITAVDGKKLIKGKDLCIGNDRVRQMTIIPKAPADHAHTLSAIDEFLHSRGCIPEKIAKRIHANSTKKDMVLASPQSERKGSQKEMKEGRGIASQNPKRQKMTNAPIDDNDIIPTKHILQQGTAQKNQTNEQLIKNIKTYRGADGWVYRCIQLIRYKLDHNDDCSSLSLDYKAPDDLTLGQWADQQKRLYREGRLALERISYLESQGFNFDRTSPPPVGDVTGDEKQYIASMELVRLIFAFIMSSTF